jgi:hypothetical protein
MALLLKVVVAEQRGRAAGAFRQGSARWGGRSRGGAVVASRSAPLLLRGHLAAAALVCGAGSVSRPAAPVPPKEPVPDAEERDRGRNRAADPPSHAAAPQSLGTALRNQSPGGTGREPDEQVRDVRAAGSLVPLFVIEGLNSDATLSNGFLVAAATQAILLLPAVGWPTARAPTRTTGGDPAHPDRDGALVIAGVRGCSWSRAISGLAAAFMGSARRPWRRHCRARRQGIVIAVFQMTADFSDVGRCWPVSGRPTRLRPAFAVGAAVAALALVRQPSCRNAAPALPADGAAVPDANPRLGGSGTMNIFNLRRSSPMITPDQALPGRAETVHAARDTRFSAPGVPERVSPIWPRVGGHGGFWGPATDVATARVHDRWGIRRLHPNPPARVCSGRTGHAEAVLVVYDPKQLPLFDLRGRSGATAPQGTAGQRCQTQYRSAIY